MPLEIRPGVSDSIPCRGCSNRCISVTLAEGERVAQCPDCDAKTRVETSINAGCWSVNTSVVRVGQLARQR